MCAAGCRGGFVPAAPGVAEPVFKPEWKKTADVYPVDGFVAHTDGNFDDPGLNAGFTDAVFSHPSCMDPRSGITSGCQLSMAPCPPRS